MDGMQPKRGKAEQSQATRDALIRVARELFAERGYADTATEEIVQRAGVTRGALYHHFRDKEDLFRAVFEDIEEENNRKVAAAALAQSGPWEQLQAGAQAFLDACLEPAVQRINLLDAPSVLGWETWRQICTRHALGSLRTVLQSAMVAGVIEAQPAEVLAHLIFGALNDGAMLIARAQDPQSARAQVGVCIDRLLAGLKAPNQ